VNDAVHQPDRRSGLRALLRAGVAAQLLAVSAPRVTPHALQPQPMCDLRRQEVTRCRDGVEAGLFPVALTALFIAPRLHLMLAATVAMAAAYVAAIIGRQWFASPVDYGNTVIIYAVFSTVFVAFVAAAEASSCAHFKSFAQAVVADRELSRANALCVAVLPVMARTTPGCSATQRWNSDSTWCRTPTTSRARCRVAHSTKS
jgi:hypothetical protein